MQLVELAYFTDDVAAMTGYYRALLGTDPVTEAESLTIFKAGDATILIHQTYTPKEGDLPPRNHTAFAVEDVDATCSELSGKGLAVEVAPRDYDWGRSAYLNDPDGHLIELIQRT